MADKIQKAYKATENIYDNVMTQGSFFSKLYIKVFWSGTDDNEIARRVLSFIPEAFDGKLLDVPVGTAVFTDKTWRKLNKAEIVCLDYSADMLAQAKARLDGCRHISFIQGDVGALTFDDETFDIVFSMNGFHAFPDKEKAFSETIRVLKRGGAFIGCFYIRGKSKITDLLVNNILSKKGWFTPPFQTEEELRQRFGKTFGSVELYTDGSIVYFKCVKQERKNERHNTY